jgi:magnesium transporter
MPANGARSPAMSSGSACSSRARELLLRVQRQFNLHDLAIEDAEHPHQRPKIEQYGDALFIVARTAQLVEGG